MSVPGVKSAFQGRAKQILIRLADHGPLTTSDLVEMLGMTRPNTCTYIARLKDEGFLETEQGDRDKRIRYHSLTAKGRENMDNWPTDQNENNSAVGGYRKKEKPAAYPRIDFDEETIDDLLDDCDRIVYND